MAITPTAPELTEIIGGQPRRLLLRNHEIERFEAQYDLGVFELFDRLFGRGPAPQARHVRDLIALGLVGGGMSDRAADDLVASLPPSDNPDLRAVAQRLIGVTFYPAVLSEPGDDTDGAGGAKKSEAGSPEAPGGQPKPTTAPASESATSSASSRA